MRIVRHDRHVLEISTPTGILVIRGDLNVTSIQVITEEDSTLIYPRPNPGGGLDPSRYRRHYGT